MSLRESAKRFTSRGGRLLHAGSALTLALGLALPQPAAACVKPPDDCDVDVWIQLDGQNVMIKARGLMTLATPADTNCACGFQQVGSLTIQQATAMYSGTGQAIQGFDFAPNANATADLESADSGSWNGLATSPLPESIPGGVRAEILFTGTVPPGTTFESLRQQILNAGSVMGFGEANNNGGFNGAPRLCAPSVVDRAPHPTPPVLAAPVLKVAGVDMSSHTLRITAQDAEEGLSRLRVSGMDSAAPSFTPGTRDLVELRLAMQPDRLTARAEIEACNSLGECAVLRPEITLLKQEGVEATSRTLTRLDAAKNRILVHNGDPGIRTFSLFVNGKRFSIRPLEPGQSLSLDISLALAEGDNTVTLASRGAPFSEAVVVLSEAPTSEPR